MLKNILNISCEPFFFFQELFMSPMASALRWLILFCSLRIFLRGEWVTFRTDGLFGLVMFFLIGADTGTF